MTDTELVQGAQDNDAEAWRTLYLRYLPTVWRYAYALVGDVHVTEDIVGETLLALLKGIDSLNTEVPKISAWLRSVVRHKVSDHHRQCCRAEERLKRMVERKVSSDLSNTSPAKPLEDEEIRNQVLEVLEGLSGHQRITLEWKYVENLRVREIADRLGETEKSVEATLYRARCEFRRLFEVCENRMPKIPILKAPNQLLSVKQVKLDCPPK